MAFRTYNNNDRTPTSTVYSGISFSNPNSDIGQTKISIGYFNKVMKISIALRTADDSNNYASYDNDNAVVAYVSNVKAEILYRLIQQMMSDKDKHNVCVEVKNGLIKVSDGSEFGSPTPCISIIYSTEDDAVHEVVYQTKADFHNGAINYSENKFDSVVFNDIELDTFAMALHEYYKASSYAVAATVWEAGMYKREYEVNLIRSIAEKVGVQLSSGNQNPARYNSKSFLSGSEGGSQGNSGMMNPPTIPKEYESSTFDDIASSMIE